MMKQFFRQCYPISVINSKNMALFFLHFFYQHLILFRTIKRMELKGGISFHKVFIRHPLFNELYRQWKL